MFNANGGNRVRNLVPYIPEISLIDVSTMKLKYLYIGYMGI